ncbi:MAG: ABC transporter ATP-binding protein, partial [Erysipelotrichia bacterium]|nr:ABC transporter ATP-binding protein [Erysipelotrichia bacterium]
KGVFDISLNIKKGEMVGFVGTNGSGKSTTIRCIIGFIKPNKGSAYVLGKESWKHAADFIKKVGYVPGEIAFPDLKTGTEFLKNQAEFFRLKDFSYANNLIKILQLDPRANLKRMSKGMKQKTALVAALMHDPEILIMDEPTTGLDPLMRINFMDVVKAEHKKGKTILMSSQSFEELEESCDRVVFLLDGRVVSVADMDEIKNRSEQELKIEFCNREDYEAFKRLNYKIVRDQSKYYQVTVSIKKGSITHLMQDLKSYKLRFISEIKYTLETHFKKVANIKEEV